MLCSENTVRYGPRFAQQRPGFFEAPPLLMLLKAGATLDDLREAVTTLEDVKRIARRVMGGEHPTTTGIEEELQLARAALRARETPSPPGTG